MALATAGHGDGWQKNQRGGRRCSSFGVARGITPAAFIAYG